jgi:hypothetical protein
MNVDQTDSAPPPYKRHCVQHFPSHYEVNFLDKIIVCTVPDCPAWTTNTNIVQNHLCIWHPLDEFKFVGVKLKRCQQCGLYMTRIPDGHINFAFCKKYSVRTQNAKQCNRLNRIMMDFLIEGKRIEWVDSFEYLGRILSADDTDDIAIYSQLEKAKKV